LKDGAKGGAIMVGSMGLSTGQWGEGSHHVEGEGGSQREKRGLLHSWILEGVHARFVLISRGEQRRKKRTL